jgi:hypothetical protein
MTTSKSIAGNLNIGPVAPSGGLRHGARRVFTPNAINTIRGLVAQGKTASDIAAVIGSTAGSVRVQCCHLKIKLRRQRQHGILARGQRLVICLPDADFAALVRKAVHMQKSTAELSSKLLEAIIRSDIYEAVLDEHE